MCSSQCLCRFGNRCKIDSARSRECGRWSISSKTELWIDVRRQLTCVRVQCPGGTASLRLAFLGAWRWCGPAAATTRSHSIDHLLYDPFKENPPTGFHRYPLKKQCHDFSCILGDLGQLWRGRVGVFSLLWLLLCCRHEVVNPRFIHSHRSVWKVSWIVRLSQEMLDQMCSWMSVRSFGDPSYWHFPHSVFFGQTVKKAWVWDVQVSGHVPSSVSCD